MIDLVWKVDLRFLRLQLNKTDGRLYYQGSSDPREVMMRALERVFPTFSIGQIIQQIEVKIGISKAEADDAHDPYLGSSLEPWEAEIKVLTPLLKMKPVFSEAEFDRKAELLLARIATFERLIGEMNAILGNTKAEREARAAYVDVARAVGQIQFEVSAVQSGRFALQMWTIFEANFSVEV